MAKAMTRTLPFLVAFLVPLSARAQIGVSVNVDVPPPIVFSAPPEVVALPDTNVYVVPDVEADIYFNGGWWWRPWQGRWYRSRYYDRGWGFYRSGPPPFYRRVSPGWRNDYREHRWQGREWNYQRVPHGEMQRNWRGWEKDRHWQQRHPGAQGMGPRPVGPGRGPMPMRGPAPMPARGPGPGGGRGFQPGQQGPRPGGPPGGMKRGPAPARGYDNRGGHGRR
jgi:hypothetical protein